MADKVALVTGANSGLGKATALGLATQGFNVVMVCRNRERGEQARQDIIAQSSNRAVDLMLADLSSQQAVRQLARDFQAKYGRLDLLVNSAGGMFTKRAESVDGIEYSLAFNHLAPFLLTNLLLDTLKASAPARIVNVTTRLFPNAAINLDDLQFTNRAYSGFQAYTETKLGNMLFTYALARRLQGQAVTVNCVHPGVFRSNFGSQGMPLPMRVLNTLFRPFMRDARQAAERVLYVATSPALDGVSGKYFGERQELTSPRQAYDEAAQERLWQASAQLTGMSHTV
ncbi:MAG: SDR family oxidoreductase [Anaerolineae bacterium]|nr:SDR family oxidoreductase [Anaerolineae bacterium]